MTKTQAELDQVKKIEKEFHEQYRVDLAESSFFIVDVEEVRRTLLQPCYTTGNDRYSDNKMAFHQIIQRDGGWAEKVVLDYACGEGTWATYFALTGASKGIGFDLAESGVRLGCQRLVRQGLTDRVKLQVADATNLPYRDGLFDIVIGTAVIHHVIKYPNVFKELHRVMKPGAKAYFLEGLADFPLFRLWWAIRGDVPSGDVPIFAKEIRAKTGMFSTVQISGDTLVYSIKRLIHRQNMGPLRRFVLRASKKVDDALFVLCPALRRWGCFSYLVFTK